MLDSLHVVSRQSAGFFGQPSFTDGGDLVGHGLPGFTLEPHESLARIHALHVLSQRHDLYTVEVTV